MVGGFGARGRGPATVGVLVIIAALASPMVILPVGPNNADDVCGDAEFTPPLPLVFAKGDRYPFVADLGTTFDSISIVSVFLTVDLSDPLDAGDRWFIDRWGGQETSYGSHTSAVLTVPHAYNGDFLDGVFVSELLDEEGSFVLTSVRFCVEKGPAGSPGWCSLRVSGASTLGRSTTIALDSQPAPRIAWQDWDTQRVHEARWGPSGWIVADVADTSYIGFASLAVDSGDRSHIAYRNHLAREIRYATEAGGAWTWERVATSGDGPMAWAGWVGLALDPSGDPHISFYGASTGDLVYAQRSGTAWTVETVDAAGDAGIHNAIAVDRAGGPRIAYMAVTPGGEFEIRYARKVAGNWSVESVSKAGTVNPGNWLGGYVSLALDSMDSPHIAFFDVDEESLRYSRLDGAVWRTVTVDVSPRLYEPTGLDTSIAIDSSDFPHISYYDWWNKDLMYARWTGSSWAVERARATGNVGTWTDLVLDGTDRPHIAYRDAWTGDIEYASREPCPEADEPPTADAGGPYLAEEGQAIEFDASGSVDPDGRPLTYRWDWDGDGTWDAETSDPRAVHTFGDDLRNHTVALQVGDGTRTATDTTLVTVLDVAPAFPGGLRAFVTADVTLRVAGERWHDVSLSLVDAESTTVAEVSLRREPGSPDTQTATIPAVSVDAAAIRMSAFVTYSPVDDPVNGMPWGATPVWIILRTGDGAEVWIPHIFNAQRPDTWSWAVEDLRPYLSGAPIALEFEVADPGSDDVTVTVDFGDGSSWTEIVYSDGIGPDPMPSPDLRPVHVGFRVLHAYASPGTHDVRIAVRDDDGATSHLSLTVPVG